MNKKTKRLFRLALAISVLSFSFCGASIAELENKDLPDRTGFKYDPLIVHAAFKTELQFDTNVFLESEDENFDVLTLLNPSVGFELPLGDNHFSADYSFGSWIFGVNNSHSYFDHTARALAEINWTDYKITLSDFYRYFSDRAGSEDVNRVKRQNNFLEATIGAEFDQLGFEAGYTFGVENFISDNTLFSSALGDITYHDKDRFLNTFAGQLSYRFLPKLSFLFDSILGILTYDSPKSSDSWYTEILMGLLGELHEDFSTNLKGGFRYQSYDTSELTDSNDFIGVVASGGISYRHTRDDIINFNVEKGYIRIYVSEPELL